MPFVLMSAIFIDSMLVTLGLSDPTSKLVLLGTSFPIGFIIGRTIYVKKSHIEILIDRSTFQVFKGSKPVLSGSWRSYRLTSLVLDNMGKANLRLYRSVGGDFVELPISKTNAEPQKFRDYVQSLISKTPISASPQVAEAA